MEDRFLDSETMGDESPMRLDEVGYHLDLDVLLGDLASQLKEKSPSQTQGKRSKSRDKHRESRSRSRDKHRRSRSRSKDKHRSRSRSRDKHRRSRSCSRDKHRRSRPRSRDKYRRSRARSRDKDRGKHRRDRKRSSSSSQESGSHSKRTKKRNNSRDSQTSRESSVKGSENQHLRLYVGNLHPEKVTEVTLRKIFSKYGEIRNIKMIKDFDTGCSLGFGFVTFQCIKDGEAALKKENGKIVTGQKMKVKLPSDETSNRREAGSGPESSKKNAEMTLLKQLEQFIIKDTQAIMDTIANRSHKGKSRWSKPNPKSRSLLHTQSTTFTIPSFTPSITTTLPPHAQSTTTTTIPSFTPGITTTLPPHSQNSTTTGPYLTPGIATTFPSHAQSSTTTPLGLWTNRPVTEAPPASKMTFKQFLDQCDNSVTAEQAFVLYSEYTKMIEEDQRLDMMHQQPPKEWSSSQNTQPYRSSSQSTQPNLNKISYLLIRIDKKVIPQKEIQNSRPRIQQAIQEQRSVNFLINTKGQPKPHLSSLVIPFTRGLRWNILQRNQIWDVDLRTHGGSHIEMGGMDAKADGGGREWKQMSTRWSSTTATQDSAPSPSCPVRSRSPRVVRSKQGKTWVPQTSNIPPLMSINMEPLPWVNSFRSQHGESSCKKANPKPRYLCQTQSNTITQPFQTEESFAIPLPDKQDKMTDIVVKRKRRRLRPSRKRVFVSTLVTIPPRQIKFVRVVTKGVKPGQLIQVTRSSSYIFKALFMRACCVRVDEESSFLLPIANITPDDKIIEPFKSLGIVHIITENDITYLDWKGNPIGGQKELGEMFHGVVPGEILSNCSSSKVTQDDGGRRTALNSILKDLDWSHLTQGQRDRLEELIVNNNKVFILNSAETGELKEPEENIETTDPSSIRMPLFRDPVIYKKNIGEMIDTMLDNDVLEESKIGYLAPLVLVNQSDGSKRMCYDCRGLDKQITIDVDIMPSSFGSMIHNIGGKKYYCHLDLRDAYHPAYRDLATHSGKLIVFRYKRLPIGLEVGLLVCTSKLQQVLTPLEWCSYYFDDIVLWADSFDQVLERLKVTLEKVAEMGIKLNVNKCSFGIKEITLLGHIFSEKFVRPDTKVIEAIKKIVSPINVKEAETFIGYCSLYKSCIHNFAAVANPITSWIKDSHISAWSDSCEKAFVVLKQKIETVVRTTANLSKPIELHIEVSNIHFGATLMQVDDDECLKAICYFSSLLSRVQKRYCVTEIETLAIVYSCRHFKAALCHNPFTIVTDHQPLSAMLGKISNFTKKAYSKEMKKYTFEVCIRRKQTVPNALSTPVGAVSNSQDVTSKDPDEKLLELAVENSIEAQGEDEC